MSSEAFVTLATNDGYALGALVVAQSLRKVGTQKHLVVLISKSLSDLIRRTLETSFDEVVLVEELNSNDTEHLNLLSRPELGVTFTKINCWLLEKYSKCVFLDSDIVVLQNIDDLFEREEFSAAPDAGWPDCFNSGVFVYRPSKETFTKLVQFASQQNASFDGGDQGLLNAFFSNWRSSDISRHLPFTYNVTSNTFYSYVPAVTQFRNDIRVVHFAGALKPWQLTYNPQNEQLSGNLGGQHEIQREFLLSWWRILYERVWPQLSKNNQGQTQGELNFSGSLLNYGSLTNDQGVQAGSVAHRRAWEAGHVDYQGRDSFNNIQEQLEKNIAQQPQQYHPSQPRQTTPPKSPNGNDQTEAAIAGVLKTTTISTTTTTTTTTTN
jgi:glycogenin glucosyltransferase